MRKLFEGFKFFALIAAIGMSLASAPQAMAQENEFGKITRVEEMISKALHFLMREQHLSGRAIDDSISERAFDMYLKTLDPLKLYFLQSDIDEFKQYRSNIDNQMVKGEFKAAFAIFSRLLVRIDERVKVAIELIDSDFDYSRDEELVTDSDLLKWPKNNAEAREIWRKRIKYNLMVLSVDQEEDAAEKKGRHSQGQFGRNKKTSSQRPERNPSKTLSLIRKTYATDGYTRRC